MARRSRQLRDQAKNLPPDPLLPPEAAKHGDFGQAIIERPDGVVGPVLRRRASVTLDRWRAEGKLTGPLDEAIKRFQDAHEQLMVGSAGTSKFSATAFIRSTGGDAETAKFQTDEARRLLALIDARVLRSRDPANVAVFRAVVLDGETAGAAGSSLDRRPEAAKKIARTIVLDIAYSIAVELGYLWPARAA